MTKQELNKTISEKGEQVIDGVTYHHISDGNTIHFKKDGIRGFIMGHDDSMYMTGFDITKFEQVIGLIKSVAYTLEIDISNIPLGPQKGDLDLIRQATLSRLEGKVEVYEKLTTGRKVTLE